MHVKKTWMVLLCVVNAVSALKNIYKAKEDFKRRVEKAYNFLYTCSKFLGKIMILHKLIKRRKALKWVKIHVIPIMKEKLKVSKMNYKKAISGTFESISSEFFFSTLQNIWRCKIVMIQRSVRHFLNCRYAKYLSLIILWKRTLLQFLKVGKDYRKEIPFLTQVYYLHRFINKIIMNYIECAYPPPSEHGYYYENGTVKRYKRKILFTFYSRKQEFKEFVVETYSMKKNWEKVNMKEYSYWKNVKFHPIEAYLAKTRFNTEHVKNRSIIKLLSQYTSKYGRIY